ncbi:hypothetical protein [Klebsiella quasivariicola]|uniref:hypothetical protein n=1 Tax=Klebsiella quasivariicola TaxID=2026240 RepID=UPI002479CA0C|nr:hypothetical protein [Klebsiella quasivariicola]
MRNRDDQATAALLYADLTQAGTLHALRVFREEIDDFCQQELRDLDRPHDRLARDLQRRLRRLARQLADSAPGPRLEGLYHNTGVVLSVPALRALCEAAGLQVSGGCDDSAAVLYNGPVMSPQGTTGSAPFVWTPQHLEAGVVRCPVDSVRFLPPPQEGAA